jgi:hypothetical protein
MRSATFWMRSTSATEEPPYFWTTMGTPQPPSHNRHPPACQVLC